MTYRKALKYAYLGDAMERPGIFAMIHRNEPLRMSIVRDDTDQFYHDLNPELPSALTVEDMEADDWTNIDTQHSV